MSERHEIPKPDAVSPDDWDAMLDALERRHAARAASGLTLLTAEQRAWIERYTSFKTDASPITKAMRKALAIIDSQAAALAAEEKNCIAFHEANQKQIAIIQEQRASLAERDAEIGRYRSALRSVVEGNWSLTGLQEVLGDLNVSQARAGGG